MNPRIILIGEAPGAANSQPFDSDSGDRLAKLAGLTGRAQLRNRFECRNVLDEYPGWSGRKKGAKFPLGDARSAVLDKADELQQRLVVIIGRRTSHVFNMQEWPFFRWFWLPDFFDPCSSIATGLPSGPWYTPLVGSPAVAVIPHPSGANLWYKKPRNYRRAAGFMRCLAARKRTAADYLNNNLNCSQVHGNSVYYEVVE